MLFGNEDVSVSFVVGGIIVENSSSSTSIFSTGGRVSTRFCNDFRARCKCSLFKVFLGVFLLMTFSLLADLSENSSIILPSSLFGEALFVLPLVSLSSLFDFRFRVFSSVFVGCVMSFRVC